MKKLLLIFFISISLNGFASSPILDDGSVKPMPVVDYVDLERFMGDWYVIATIPTFLEKDAFNPVETYQLSSDGSIATTFTFNKGGLNGPKKYIDLVALLKISALMRFGVCSLSGQ